MNCKELFYLIGYVGYFFGVLNTLFAYWITPKIINYFKKKIKDSLTVRDYH